MIGNLFISIFGGGFIGLFIAMTLDAIFNSKKNMTKELSNLILFVSIVGSIIASFVVLST